MRDCHLAILGKTIIAVISLLTVTLLVNASTKQLAQSGPEATTRTQQPRVPADPRRWPPSNTSDDLARQKSLKAKQAKALKHLNQLVDEATSIVDAAARSRILARVSDALWPYDEARARILFRLAFDQAINVPKSDETINLSRPICGLVRAEIARLLSTKDPKFAAELVASSARETSCDYGPRERSSSSHPRSELLADTALSIVDNDPPGAYRLGLASLEQGITLHVGDLLNRLFSRDRRLGEQLLSSCIARITNEDVDALEIHNVAYFLFGDEISIDRQQRTAAKVEEQADLKRAFGKELLEAALIATDRFVRKIEAQQEGKANPHDRASDPGIQEVWTRAADIQELAGSYYSTMLNVLEGLRRYDPDKLPAAQGLMDRLGRWMDPLDLEHMLVFYDNGDTPESLVAEAETKNDPSQKQELYELAAELAQQKGDNARALELAAKIEDQDRRNYLTDGLWLNRAARVSGDKLDEVHAIIEKMARPEGRLRALIELAYRISPSDEGQKAAAISLLDEAQRLLMTCSPSLRQAQTMMELARLYAQVDPTLGFDAAARAIAMVNSTPDPPVADKTRWQFAPGVTPSDPITLFASDTRLFETLARLDYDRTMQLAERFNNPAVGIAAQLSAIRTALPPHGAGSGGKNQVVTPEDF
jgi:hypothetical protein